MAVPDDVLLHVSLLLIIVAPECPVLEDSFASGSGSSINVPCSYVSLDEIVSYRRLPPVKTDLYRFPSDHINSTELFKWKAVKFFSLQMLDPSMIIGVITRKKIIVRNVHAIYVLFLQITYKLFIFDSRVYKLIYYFTILRVDF